MVAGKGGFIAVCLGHFSLAVLFAAIRWEEPGWIYQRVNALILSSTVKLKLNANLRNCSYGRDGRWTPGSGRLMTNSEIRLHRFANFRRVQRHGQKARHLLEHQLNGGRQSEVALVECQGASSGCRTETSNRTAY